ncbi:TIGR03943 family putative permease subunit [Streptomyces sp. MB09-02B]|uniref:TIGR03943 family putative permease subunit n=1 Tax=Streptomyces sp. MB09-02B TaxID=3028667 RepID=UPI0029AB5B69|nr:TIGR03943 family protein [Streptomyces sp. MB09-02B]MDX3645292.1 TIGR03943 family protein [Streptomyces sp. MB09-02B]
MKRPLQALLLLLSGLGLLHATVLTDDYLRYVKEGMHPLLVASGALLLFLGAAEAWSLWRPGVKDEREADTGTDPAAATDSHAGPDPDPDAGPDPDGHGHGHGHDHSTPPRVAWLLLLPALSLLFYAPPAIGAYTASRGAPKAVAVTDQDDFDPLPKTSPLPITLTDFTRRVQQDRERAIDGRTVEMTGFVTPDKGTATEGDGDDASTGWYLTRAIFSCCAADAQFVKVRVHGAPPPPADTWVTLTGTWHSSGTLGTSSAEAALDAHTVRKVPRPPNAYADTLTPTR